MRTFSSWLLGAAILFLAVNAQAVVNAPFVRPVGNYAWNATTGSCGTNNLAINPIYLNGNNDQTLGITVEIAWRDLQSAPGVLTTSCLDNLLATARANGLQIVLGLPMANIYANDRSGNPSAPAFAVNAAAHHINLIWDRGGFGPTICTPVTLPLFTDPQFVSYETAFIQQMGEKYSAAWQDVIRGVIIEGLGYATDEVFPTPLDQEAISANCNGLVMSTQFQAAGYTQQAGILTTHAMINTFVRYWPYQTNYFVVVGGPFFPPIDANGNIMNPIPALLDEYPVSDALTYLSTIQPNGDGVAIANLGSLSTGVAVSPSVLITANSKRVAVGTQPTGAICPSGSGCVSLTNYCTLLTIAQTFQFLEPYTVDISAGGYVSAMQTCQNQASTIAQYMP